MVAENRAAAFALLRYDPRPALRLSANLRQAALPAGLAPLTPTAGLEWDLLAPAAATADDSLPTARIYLLTQTLTARAAWPAATGPPR